MTQKSALTYFIADLHLAQDRPDITACFLSFLENQAVKAEKLYILGDLFESWVGDDDQSELNVSVANALRALSATRTQVFFIHGNRDFLLGNRYARQSNMVLLDEVSTIDLYGQKAVIMHGDTLCTMDHGYQAFRKKSRSWWWQFLIKSLPLKMRLKKAADYRKRSANATAMKNTDIMDVTPEEVVNVLAQYNSRLLIHGHTHRPNIHNLTVGEHAAKRIVLGDWYEQGSWLKVTPEKIELLNTPFIN